MKNKYLTALIIVIVITGIYFLGRKLLEPKFGESEPNPFDLKLDSIGKIDSDNFGNYKYSQIQLELKEAKAIAFLYDQIFVSGDNKLQVLNKKGILIREFSTSGTATAIEVFEEKIFSGIKDHIEIYNTEGKLLSKFKSFGEKAYITSLTILNNKIYAAEAEAELVYELNDQGDITDIIGDSVPASDIMRFVLPSYYFDVAIDPDGFLWISNTGKHKLINVNTENKMRSYWGTSSSEIQDFCGCCNPTHFKITEDGSFITSEKGIVRIKKYDAAGKFVHAIAGPEFFKKGSEGLDITIDDEGGIYVLEPAASIIHVFKEI